MSTSALLSVRHLQLAVTAPDGTGSLELLKPVTLDIYAGDRIALVGGSGSGKTLLLRSLAALEPCARGEIFFRSKRLSDREIVLYRTSVLYVHQRPALDEGTVEKNINSVFDFAANRQKTRNRDELVHLLEISGFDERFLSKDIRTLSGGEAQIVSLLRALQIQPCMLLLDEPTSALDENRARAVEAIVLSWQQSAPGTRSFVWVSHNREQASRVAKRWLRMDKGRLAEEKR